MAHSGQEEGLILPVTQIERELPELIFTEIDSRMAHAAISGRSELRWPLVERLLDQSVLADSIPATYFLGKLGLTEANEVIGEY